MIFAEQPGEGPGNWASNTGIASKDETGYNKNNNFDNRRISRTCVLSAQKNCLIECLKHIFQIERKQPKPRFGCLKGPSH